MKSLKELAEVLLMEIETLKTLKNDNTKITGTITMLSLVAHDAEHLAKTVLDEDKKAA